MPSSIIKKVADPAAKPVKIAFAILVLLVFSLAAPLRAPARPGNPKAPTTKTTFSPPGADAINLKISQHYKLKSDGAIHHRLYVRRRILTYKGKKDYADFKYTYNQAFEKVRLIGARTFKSDGTVVEVGDKEIHDIPAPWNSGAALYSRTRQLVVNLPAVEPGCEIELELETTSRLGFWCAEYFRFSDPILDKEVVIEAPASLAIRFRPPSRVKLARTTRKGEDGTVVYRWQAHRIAGLTPARWTPDEAEEGYCLLVTSLADNRAVAALFRRGFPGLEADRKRPESAAAKTAAADKNPASFRIFTKLSRQTTPFVISFQETDMQVQPPARTAASGYGRDADLALLFYRRLREKGLAARLLMTCGGSRFPEIFGDFPWPGWWDATVVECQGHFFYFGSDKPAPGITGFDGCPALDLASGRLVTIHDRQPASATSEVVIHPGKLPSAKGSFTLTLQGEAATGGRRSWRNLSPGERKIAASQLLHELNPTAAYTAPLAIDGLDNPLAPLVFRGRFKVRQLFARLEQGRYLLALPDPGFPTPWPTLLQNRERPVAITENFTTENRLILHLGHNLKPAAMPTAISGRTANCRWQTATRYDPAAGTLSWVRKYHQQRGIFAAGSSPDYGRFLAAVRALAANENLGLVLEPVTGNR